MNDRPQERDSAITLLLIDTSIVGVTVGIMSHSKTPLGASSEGNLALVAHAGHYDNAGSIAMISALTDRCLKQAECHPADIRGIVISRGPGSFTGIKIGLAFAQGWACGLVETPLWLGVSALEQAAIRRSADLGGKKVALFLPATRTHGFLAEAQGALAGSARLIDVSTWDQTSKRFGSDLFDHATTAQLDIVGTWPLLEKTWQDSGLVYHARPAKDIAHEALLSMADLAARAWPKNFSSAIPDPNYLRLSTAEEQLAQRALLARRHEETP